MKKVVPVIAFSLALFSCTKEQPQFLSEGDIGADFDYQIAGDCSTPVLEVILENKTAKADSYLWEFGDGTSSTLENPKKVYSKAGNYTIRLNAYFSTVASKVEKQVSIFKNSDGTGATGQLSYTRSNAANFELTFHITTAEPSYTLDFGDGSVPVSSNQKSIKHTYAAPGMYSALLIIQGNEGSGCASAVIDLKP